MPIIIIPVFASLIVGLAFVFLIGAPVAHIFASLTVWLAGMKGSSSILLALILGAMISFDMGGPVNKVAFLFGSAMIGEGNYEIMGPIAVSICIPPIGLGIATFLGKENSPPQKEKWEKRHLRWAFSVSRKEPFHLRPKTPSCDPEYYGGFYDRIGDSDDRPCGDRVAHGGPIVAVLGAVDHVLMFLSL